jgi:hypothetical protein
VFVGTECGESCIEVRNIFRKKDNEFIDGTFQSSESDMVLLPQRGMSKVPSIASDKELAKLESLRRSSNRSNRQSRPGEARATMDPRKARKSSQTCSHYFAVRASTIFW